MSDAWQHAVSSSHHFGGTPENYYEIHKWFDETKNHYADIRHRALRHHTLGVEWAIAKFGDTIEVKSQKYGILESKKVSVRMIAEQHIREDLGKIPTVQDWLECIQPQGWMNRASDKSSC